MVSIIIVNYNTKQMTLECIESIFEKTKDVDFEIILVDNASCDGSKECFENDSRIKYIYSYDNLGFGGGNNLGYKYAKGDYVFLLNSDTLLLNNAVKEFYDFMQKAPKNIACVGCVLQNKTGYRIHSYHSSFPSLSWFFKEIAYFSIPVIRFMYNPYKEREKKQSKDIYPTKVAVITGADIFIRREAIEKCGLFDTDFFMYYEETEMQYRFKQNNFESFIIDTPKIVHLVGASFSTRKRSLKKDQVILKSRFLYVKKTFSPIKRLICFGFHLMMIPRILISFKSLWTERLELIKIILRLK